MHRTQESPFPTKCSHHCTTCTMERVEQRVDRGRDKQILIPGLSVRCHGIQSLKVAISDNGKNKSIVLVHLKSQHKTTTFRLMVMAGNPVKIIVVTQ
ncbi:hypothetical protein Y1Q_0004196 [Alligator mississippiensis]|uniref:Uncharacterized protein n=1 Tax=Alligator mississippiensis TaxID=8496 RepID=A0A151PIA3_ALLMI|nr:hypothetical protein Y1Q_0004196 [Alligator mississippiensis]